MNMLYRIIKCGPEQYSVQTKKLFFWITETVTYENMVGKTETYPACFTGTKGIALARLFLSGKYQVKPKKVELKKQEEQVKKQPAQIVEEGLVENLYLLKD